GDPRPDEPAVVLAGGQLRVLGLLVVEPEKPALVEEEQPLRRRDEHAGPAAEPALDERDDVLAGLEQLRQLAQLGDRELSAQAAERDGIRRHGVAIGTSPPRA